MLVACLRSIARGLAACLLAGTLVVPAGAGTPLADSLDRSIPSTGGGTSPSAASATLPRVDRVVVRKSERRLYLMYGTTTVRSYRAALGLNPVGHKEREGDFRTPEGRYTLVSRNPRSDFFLSIKVSYPNSRDVAHARRNGWRPGGSIMIHGLPNDPRMAAEYYATQDWTDGCIAVSNSDMLEIWMLVQDNTPIYIEP